MAKVTLVGRVVAEDGSFRDAKTQEAADVLAFVGPNPDGAVPEYFHAEKISDGKYKLTTPKGSYILGKLPGKNTWSVVIGNIRLFLSPKKVVAHLTWS